MGKIYRNEDKQKKSRPRTGKHLEGLMYLREVIEEGKIPEARLILAQERLLTHPLASVDDFKMLEKKGLTADIKNKAKLIQEKKKFVSVVYDPDSSRKHVNSLLRRVVRGELEIV